MRGKRMNRIVDVLKIHFPVALHDRAQAPAGNFDRAFRRSIDEVVQYRRHGTGIFLEGRPVSGQPDEDESPMVCRRGTYQPFAREAGVQRRIVVFRAERHRQ